MRQQENNKATFNVESQVQFHQHNNSKCRKGKQQGRAQWDWIFFKLKKIELKSKNFTQRVVELLVSEHKNKRFHGDTADDSNSKNSKHQLFIRIKKHRKSSQTPPARNRKF